MTWELRASRWYGIEDEEPESEPGQDEAPAMDPELGDADVVAHLRAWVRADREREHGAFNWPTDGCGYDQHLRFVHHRNACWAGSSREEWRAFVLAYADRLEATLPCSCGGAHAVDTHVITPVHTDEEVGR